MGIKTFEEFTFKGFIDNVRGKKKEVLPERRRRDQWMLAEKEPYGAEYESMFVGTGSRFIMEQWAKLARLSALDGFIIPGEWYYIHYHQPSMKNKIIKIEQKFYNEKDSDFKIYYREEFKENEIVNDVRTHRRYELQPHILVINIWNTESASITIERLETIEHRKNMEIFKKLNIKKGDNIVAWKFVKTNDPNGPNINLSKHITFKVTGIDKGFYWGRMDDISGYKIYAKDVIENLGPNIINKDVDPYGEEDWD